MFNIGLTNKNLAKLIVIQLYHNVVCMYKIKVANLETNVNTLLFYANVLFA